MKVFYVDTSSSCLYAGITEDNNLIAEVKEELGHDMSKFAMPRIADLFNKSDIFPTMELYFKIEFVFLSKFNSKYQ